MKNSKTIIISSILSLSVLVFAGQAFASETSLSVSPLSLTKNVGETLDISVGLITGGSKVCVVEGTLAFENLSCVSISVAEGLIAQTTPTCANPHFEIGIPSCTTSDKALFKVSAQAKYAGNATVGFTKVDIIGAGTSLSSNSAFGTYTIHAPVATPKTQPETVKPVVAAPTTSADTQSATVEQPTPAASSTEINTSSTSASNTQQGADKQLAAAGVSKTPYATAGIIVLAILFGWWFLQKKK